MAIDWFTVGAQVINFLVLVYLLKRFLYGPIVRAMERREQAIAARLDDAESRVLAATREKELYTARREELESEREALMEAAREDSRQERTRTLAALREEIASKRGEWQAQLQREQQALLKNVRRALSERVAGATHRILSDLANADLQREALKKFLTQLGELPDEQRQSLVEHTDGAPSEVTLSTAFELDGGQRKHLAAELRALLAADVEVRFEQSPELVCGVALDAAGRRLSWNVGSYLEDLSSATAEAFAEMDSGRANAEVTKSD
jgi:F-type H+-transporting ATPase subunit b